ncbi:hypothetical protein [Streptomyces sp. NPDC093600]|uniref:hypothetical protein n=1 Tax=Streptomyces sp. NPDC093600 TaxID=3366047 RepID=UPI0038255544
MSRITLPRTGPRLSIAATAVLLAAGPASAHVEVASDSAQALVQNAELNFNAASESTAAGITELRVILPEGVTLPTSRTARAQGLEVRGHHDGYTIKGPAR